jgi:hypothetical protein
MFDEFMRATSCGERPMSDPRAALEGAETRGIPVAVGGTATFRGGTATVDGL